MKALRWVLAPLAGIAAWYAVFFVGILAYQLVEQLACPPDRMISGTCMDDSFERYLQGVIVFFVALSAVAVVLATVAVAPSHRVAVAWTAFTLGALLAGTFAMATEMHASGVAALLSGLATTVAITRFARGRATVD